MQVKGISTVPSVDSVALAALADMFRPSRLNFAQVCLYCEMRWCESEECVAAHAASLWAPCESCDGFNVGRCTQCLNGVVEVTRAGLIELADRVLPRRPEASATFVAVA